MDNRPIGFFDSGIGGLSCVEAMMDAFPGENVIYFGDTARTPYGSKSAATITKYSTQIIDYLISCDIKMLVIACNTVSAVCVEKLRSTYPELPIIGIIEPCVSFLADQKGPLSRRLGLIATQATVDSGRYARLLREYGIYIPFFSKACPLFVPMIECGFLEGPVADATIHSYLDAFIAESGIDSLILGCTHYPFIRDSIRRLYPSLQIINPSEIIVNQISNVLRWNDLYADPNQEPNHKFYASDLSENMMNLVCHIMGDREYRIDRLVFE